MALETPDVPLIFKHLNPRPVLLAQGAEAMAYKTFYLSTSRPSILKFRPPKKWRHPILDARLTQHRILVEARILVKCRRAGVPVPGVLALDWEGRKDPGQSTEGGWMMMEWIEGSTVRNALNAWTQALSSGESSVSDSERNRAVLDLMQRIGQVVAKLHAAGIIHGDLTTSNLMLKQDMQTQERATPGLDGEVFVIDFGLAASSTKEEDRAVDLYVLERAYGSTHPTMEDHFQEVLRAYGESYKGAKQVLKRLEAVRQRGRKKSMLG